MRKNWVISDDWSTSRQFFRDAADWFVAETAQVGGRWADPGLGEWDVRALVGHTSRSLLTVETYLGVPATAVDLDSPTAYYLAGAGRDPGPLCVRYRR